VNSTENRVGQLGVEPVEVPVLPGPERPDILMVRPFTFESVEGQEGYACTC